MFKFIRTIAIAALFLGAGLMAEAQSIKLSGRIVDNNGLGLIAVTVYEEGNTSNGTVSDADGNYSITVSPTSTVVYSCLGYNEVREIPGKRNVINVTMADESLSLDAAEVVSVGYGSVARRDLTGSVAKVDMAEIMKTPSTNFDQALTGRVAGVVVTTSDGALGAEANITIRGNNSLTQSSAPLYIIDGFPSESSMATSLNPADIESIDILKDASATAIYGARGANGVIVITTKQGIEGKPKINFSATFTMNEILNKVELMDAYDFAVFQTDRAEIYGGSNPYVDETYTLEDYRNAESIDWQDMIYRKALVQNYNVSLSGGNKKAGNRYNVNFSATDQDGIIVNSNFQRYQGKINFSQKLGENITVDVLANYARSVTSGTNPTAAQQSSSASGWLLYSTWGYRPTKPLSQIGGVNGGDSLINDIIDSDIQSADDYRFNPAKSVRNEHRKTITDYLNGNIGLTWQITEGLKLKVTGGYTMNKRRQEAFNGTQTYTGYAGSPSGKGINGSIYWTDKVTWLNENTLTWNKRFARKHNLQLLGGLTFQGETANYKGVVSENMTTETLGLNGMHTGKYQNVTPWQRDWKMMSGFVRLNYNYQYKYYLTASFRADGSSRFPKNNRWGYFPSVGASWNFNREDWLKDSKWLNNGKIRLSWGMTGNNRTSTPYDFYSQISTNPGSAGSYDYVFGGQTIPGYYPSNMENTELKWETTEQMNVGLDLGLFDSRIKFNFDWYLKNTRDLLLQATIPSSSGYSYAMMNIGSMKNTGVEFTLETVNINKRNFQWSTTFNIALNRNIVTALTNNQYSLLSSVSWEQRFNKQFPYITQVGKPSGMMYGFIYEGTYKEEDFNGSALREDVACLASEDRGSISPGDPKYRDINEDGVIDDHDRTVIGCGQPLHTGGFGNTFTFYGFDVNIFFSWSYGNDVLNANKLIFENGNFNNLNQFKSYNNRFDPVDNPDSDIPRIKANGIFHYSSRVVEDGSFLKLRNVSVGYTLPRRVLRKMHFDTMRIHVSADNILTFTNYTGPDPEVSTRNSVLTPGFDWSAYPRAFGLTAGVSFTF